MILLWDSSDMNVSFSLVDSDGAAHDYEWHAGRTLAKNMLAYLRDSLAELDASFEDITGIGVFRGPGSFTGLRIGLAVLNTFADANGIPIVGGTGEGWRGEVLARLKAREDDKLVLPEYGGEAHITKPRK